MNLELAPKSGIKYAIYKDRVEFEKYELEDLLNDNKLKENLLELHLFDSNSELRVIESNRGEIITIVSDDNEDFENRYIERVYTNGSSDELRQVDVVNYVTFDDNDIAMINNYRLSEVR